MIVFKNIIYQIIGKVVSVIATAIGISLITKALGVEFYGKYIFVITFLTIFFTFSDWGINSVVVKQLSTQKLISKEYFTKVFITRVLFSLLMCVLAVFTGVLFRLEKNIMLAIIVGLPMILSYSINSTASIIFQTKFQYKYDFIVKFIYSIFSVIAIYYLINQTKVVWIIVLALVIGWVVSSFFSIYFVRKYLSLKSLKVDIKFVKNLLVLSLPIGVALIINTLLSQVDKLIIPSLLDYRQAGYYGLSYKGFEFLLVFPTFFVNSIYVILANKTFNKEIFKHSIKILILASTVITFFSIFFAPDIIKMLSSKDFSLSILPFQVLSFGLVIFFITALLRLQLIVEGKEKLFFYIYFSSLTLNIILNIVLLPAIGILGASYATILSELLVFILMLKEITIRVIDKNNLLYFNKVVLVCSLTFLPLVFFHISNAFFQLIVACFLFVIFAYSFGLISLLISMVKNIEKQVPS